MKDFLDGVDMTMTNDLRVLGGTRHRSSVLGIGIPSSRIYRVAEFRRSGGGCRILEPRRRMVTV